MKKFKLDGTRLVPKMAKKLISNVLVASFLAGACSQVAFFNSFAFEGPTEDGGEQYVDKGHDTSFGISNVSEVKKLVFKKTMPTDRIIVDDSKEIKKVAELKQAAAIAKASYGGALTVDEDKFQTVAAQKEQMKLLQDKVKAYADNLIGSSGLIESTGMLVPGSKTTEAVDKADEAFEEAMGAISKGDDWGTYEKRDIEAALKKLVEQVTSAAVTCLSEMAGKITIDADFNYTCEHEVTSEQFAAAKLIADVLTYLQNEITPSGGSDPWGIGNNLYDDDDHTFATQANNIKVYARDCADKGADGRFNMKMSGAGVNFEDFFEADFDGMAFNLMHEYKIDGDFACKNSELVGNRGVVGAGGYIVQFVGAEEDQFTKTTTFTWHIYANVYTETGTNYTAAEVANGNVLLGTVLRPGDDGNGNIIYTEMQETYGGLTKFKITESAVPDGFRSKFGVISNSGEDGCMYEYVNFDQEGTGTETEYVAQISNEFKGYDCMSEIVIVFDSADIENGSIKLSDLDSDKAALFKADNSSGLQILLKTGEDPQEQTWTLVASENALDLGALNFMVQSSEMEEIDHQTQYKFVVQYKSSKKEGEAFKVFVKSDIDKYEISVGPELVSEE